MIFSEQDKEDWALWLANFRESVYPIFEAQGLSFGEAVIVMQLNRINNNVVDVENALGPDEDEEWKR